MLQVGGIRSSRWMILLLKESDVLKTCAIVIKVKDYEYDSSYDYKTSWQKRLASTTAVGRKKVLKLLSSRARKSPFVAGVKTDFSLPYFFILFFSVTGIITYHKLFFFLSRKCSTIVLCQITTSMRYFFIYFYFFNLTEVKCSVQVVRQMQNLSLMRITQQHSNSCSLRDFITT